jgi:2-hydroxychromene-2-carboxylate isomerase
VAAALNDAGLPGDDLVADAKNNANAYADLVAKDSQSAIDANIFGAPSFVVDGQVFWGQDRLDMLGWYLANRT